MGYRLKEGEVITKKLREGWHAIQHKEKIKWFRTAYKTKLWRNLILTNQRILFLKNDEINYEIPLENVLKAESKRVMKMGSPYITLQLKDGNLIHVVFESIRERVWDSLLGVPLEPQTASRMTKEWEKEINLQINKI